jgi:hypothetical protein
MTRAGVRTGRGMTLKVYGVRVERTETAVHLVCLSVPVDPNRTVCPCGFCRLEESLHARWSRC